MFGDVISASGEELDELDVRYVLWGLRKPEECCEVGCTLEDVCSNVSGCVYICVQLHDSYIQPHLAYVPSGISTAATLPFSNAV